MCLGPETLSTSHQLGGHFTPETSSTQSPGLYRSRAKPHITGLPWQGNMGHPKGYSGCPSVCTKCITHSVPHSSTLERAN